MYVQPREEDCNNCMTLKETGKYFKTDERNKIDDIKENDIKEKTIVIQGTSLSASEIALSLVDRGARVHMISRHGLLPALRLPYNNNYKRQFLTIENLEKRSIRRVFSPRRCAYIIKAGD